MSSTLPETPNAAGIRIRAAFDSAADVKSLAEVLLDCVEGGASVGFMYPLPRQKAVAFWVDALASAARGQRLVLVAEEVGTGKIVGTVQIITVLPENQPHRCDVAKMLVHRRARRRRGVGEALMRAAERVSRYLGLPR